MPRIRKKTSNRTKINDRHKVQKKVKDSRKKKAKLAKKNPQWKSKHKKDPGIPNDFPYKDELLAEVAEQRRVAEEEKRQRKAEKKAASKVQVEHTEQDPAFENEDENEEGEERLKISNVGSEGIASLSAKLVTGALKRREGAPLRVEEEEEEEEVPALADSDFPDLKSVLDEVDVLVQVLDARDPQAFRSEHLEELMIGKRLLFILNKIDTSPREALVSWSTRLRKQHPTLIFRSATPFLPSETLEQSTQVNGKGKGKKKASADDALGVDAVLAYLGSWAQEKKGEEPLVVAVVGVANVGKSSFINSLLRRRVLPVYSLVSSSSSSDPTTTVLPQEVMLEASGKPIRIIDTPGLSWQADEALEKEDWDALRAKDILLRSRGRIDRLKDPLPAVAHIVSRAATENLMVHYNLPAFTKGDFSAFLAGIARSNQLVKKKGELDLAGAARILLRDWNVGKFPRYTLPLDDTESDAEKQAADSGPEGLYASEEAILATVPTRKEMRKAGGLVKLVSGSIEKRRAAIKEPWTNQDEDEDEDDEESEEGIVSDIEEGHDSEESEDENGSDAEEIASDLDNEQSEDESESDASPPIPKMAKRKRGAETVALPPNKKVTFKRGPKEPVQRKPDSLKGQINQKEDEKTRTVLKSALKPPSPPKPLTRTKPLVSKSSKQKGKIANQSSKGAVSNETATGEEAYDFRTFF